MSFKSCHRERNKQHEECPEKSECGVYDIKQNVSGNHKVCEEFAIQINWILLFLLCTSPLVPNTCSCGEAYDMFLGNNFSFRILIQGPVTLKIFPTEFKFDENLILLSLKF